MKQCSRKSKFVNLFEVTAMLSSCRLHILVVFVLTRRRRNDHYHSLKSAECLALALVCHLPLLIWCNYITFCLTSRDDHQLAYPPAAAAPPSLSPCLPGSAWRNVTVIAYLCTFDCNVMQHCCRAKYRKGQVNQYGYDRYWPNISTSIRYRSSKQL